MNTLADAKAELEGKGLLVSSSDDRSLFIAGSFRDFENGIKLSQDACVLTLDSSRWVAVFPGEGMTTVEVEGTLPDLVSLLDNVYQLYRSQGGMLKDAVKKVVGNLPSSRPNGQAAKKDGAFPSVPAER